MYEKYRYLPSGDNGIIIEIGSKISEEINGKVRGLTLCIENEKPEGVLEIIPTYTSILIIYDPVIVSYYDLLKKLKEIEKRMKEITLPAPEVVHIPTCYGGEYGMDLEYVAEYNELRPEEVIKIHSERQYLVYMLGFTPGFPYLGGMSKKIATPRLESPREKILGGSVGIAGNQTGIYPIDSPGGWRIIGRTPLNFFDPSKNPPVLLKAGQYIKFDPIDKEEYELIKKQVKRKEYTVKKSRLKRGDFNE